MIDRKDKITLTKGDLHAFKTADPLTAGAAWLALVNYHIEGKMPERGELNAIGDLIFRLLKDRTDEGLARQREIRAKRAEYGKLGGARVKEMLALAEEAEKEPEPQPRSHAIGSRKAQICLRPALKQRLQGWADKKHLPLHGAIDRIVHNTLKRRGEQQIAPSGSKYARGIKMHPQEAYLRPETWQLVDANIGERKLSEFLRAIIETFFNFNHQPSTKEQ